MKITAMLLMVAGLQVQAAAVFSQSRINMKVKNASVKEVLRRIKAQTDYRLFYNDNALPDDKKVTLRVNNATLAEVLEATFAGTGFLYEIRPSGLVLIERANQPDIQVSGIIKDEAGAPLPGVAVVQKGSPKGTTTNNEGAFTLTVSADAVLSVNLLGYSPQEVPVNNRSAINITMQRSTSLLEQVVVVGYGTQKKSNLTGAIGTVNVAQAMNAKPVTNVQELLAGTVPGLNIRKTTGAVGAAATVNIRGTATLGSSSGVLVLIDGIPGNMHTLNPNDIANISVLKDAASAAIYGSRAANGVILVTTKKGQGNGKPVVEIVSSIGLQKPQFMVDFIGAADYMRLWDQAMVNDKKPEVYGQQGQEDLKAGKYADTRWYKEIYKKNTVISNNYMSVSGQKSDITYRLAGSYDYQDGTLPNNDYRRYMVRPDVTIKLTKDLSLSANIQYTETQIGEPQGGTEGWQSQATRVAPISFIKTKQGRYAIGSSMAGNPIAGVYEGGFNKTKVKELMSIFDVSWTPLKNWNIKGTYSSYAYDSWVTNRVSTYFLYDDQGNVVSTQNKVSSLRNASSSSQRNLLQLVTDYTHHLRDHHFKILGGYSQELYNIGNFFASRDGLPFPGIHVLDVGTLNKQSGGRADDVAIQSVFARLNYDYEGRYLFEANIRGDGSSRFARGNRWGAFPSFSAGWNINREKFMSGQANWLSELKLRASWGILGDAEKVGYYSTYELLKYAPNTYGFNGAMVPGAFVETAVNKDIQWEQSQLANIGLNAAFLDGKTGLTVDYFINNRSNILYPPPVPLEFGLKPPTRNLLKMENRGLEISAWYKDRKGDLNWGVDANASFSRNRVSDLAGTGPWVDGSTLTSQGDQYQLPYGLEATGLFQSADEVAKSANQGPNVFAGNIKYKDQNSDGVIDGKDRVVLNRKVPLRFGLNLNAGWKGFDFAVNVYGTMNTMRYISGYEGWAFYLSQNARPMHLDSWTPQNPGGKYPRLSMQYTSNDQKYSSFWLRKSDYLKLQNMQLGYTLPKSWLDRAKISYLRVYVSAQNLATFTRYEGFDPEGGYYPISRTMAFGANFKF